MTIDQNQNKLSKADIKANKALSAYMGNKNIIRAGYKQSFTQEQLEEYAKCAEDPVYFCKKYIKIIHVDKGKIPFELWPFQEKMINLMVNERFLISKIPRQSGKCCHPTVTLQIRHKKTGEIKKISIGDFYESQKSLT